MNITALLTGRSNSTLKDKNILPVCGRPLLYYPAAAAKRSKYITDFYVSSDDEKILNEACKLGYKKIVRPPELSKPDSQHVSAILHALDCMKKQKKEPDILVVLLSNSATIKTEWIDGCIKLIMGDGSISAAVPVNLDLDHHPYRAKRINKEGMLDTFIDLRDRVVSTNRQDLERSYFLCHNFWVLNVKMSVYSNAGQPPWTFMGNMVKAYVVDKCFDVHEADDIEVTERWVRKNWTDE